MPSAEIVTDGSGVDGASTPRPPTTEAAVIPCARTSSTCLHLDVRVLSASTPLSTPIREANEAVRDGVVPTEYPG